MKYIIMGSTVLFVALVGFFSSMLIPNRESVKHSASLSFKPLSGVALDNTPSIIDESLDVEVDIKGRIS